MSSHMLFPGMKVFETSALLDDASHLTLLKPVPPGHPRECRVLILFDNAEGTLPSAWPLGFFDEIRIDDPAFQRPAQGEVPANVALDA